MIAGRDFSKKTGCSTQKVLEGREIPEGYFTEKESKSLLDNKVIFKDQKAYEDHIKPKDPKAETPKTNKADK